MPSAVAGDGRKTVTTAGTAVQLSTTVTRCNSVAITALSTNTDVVCVGGSTVVAAAGTRRGTPLAPGETMTWTVATLGLLYLDSVVNGEGVSYAYEAS